MVRTNFKLGKNVLINKTVLDRRSWVAKEKYEEIEDGIRENMAECKK